MDENYTGNGEQVDLYTVNAIYRAQLIHEDPQVLVSEGQIN
jgi:hypothetical protein